MGEEMPVHGDAGLARRGPVALIVSPHAGHASNHASDIVPREALEAAGIAVGKQIAVSDLDHRLPQGVAWREQGIVAAVAAGGDGTIGAVATQVAGSGLPLGILPLGTSNDVARALGVPLELAAASSAIAHGVPVEVDTGQALPAVTEPGALAVEPGPHAGTAAPPELEAALAASGAHFVHALTLGLNVAFARLATDVARRQRWGSLTYATSALEAVAHFEPVPVTLRLSGARTLGPEGTWHESPDDLEVKCQAVQLAVVNMPVFGGAMNLRMSRVDMHDRLLDFLLIEALEPRRLRATIEGLVESLEKLGESFQAWHRPRNNGEASRQDTSHTRAPSELGLYQLPGVRRYQASAAEVRTPRHVDVTLDGEIRAHTPVQVRIAPEPLRVLLPLERQQPQP